jgi:hypothetical protein
MAITPEFYQGKLRSKIYLLVILPCLIILFVAEFDKTAKIANNNFTFYLNTHDGGMKEAFYEALYTNYVRNWCPSLSLMT